MGASGLASSSSSSLMGVCNILACCDGNTSRSSPISFLRTLPYTRGNSLNHTNSAQIMRSWTITARAVAHESDDIRTYPPHANRYLYDSVSGISFIILMICGRLNVLLRRGFRRSLPAVLSSLLLLF